MANKIDNVFLVWSSWGEWEDRGERIVAVYINEETAQNHVKLLEKEETEYRACTEKKDFVSVWDKTRNRSYPEYCEYSYSKQRVSKEIEKLC